MNRTFFVLAGIGALLASAYWAALTLLIGLDVSHGSGSMFRIVLPCVLIVLYAWRGVQIFRGDAMAAKRILWLHGIGGVMAVVQIASGNVIVAVLYGIKLVIHVFGAATAYMAQRPYPAGQGL